MRHTDEAPVFITGRIGGWCARHRRLVAPLGLIALILAFVAITNVGADTDPDQGGTGESIVAAELLEERFGDLASSDPPSEFVVFSHPALTVDDPQYRSTVTGLMDELRGLRFEAVEDSSPIARVSTRVVGNTLTHYDIGAPREQSPFVATRDGAGDVTYAVVELEGEVDASAASSVPFVFDEIELVTDAVAEFAPPQGFEIVIGGDASVSKQAEDNIAEDFGRASQVNLPLTLIILIIALGTLLAALLPIGLAFGGVITAIGVLALLSRLYPLDPVFIQVVLLIGLAAGIDYALFMIAGYRREREEGLERVAAVTATWSTTGRNVLIAATTTVLSIAGMYLVGDPIFTALGLAAMVAVIVAAITAMTILPALTGDWLNRLRVPGMRREGRTRDSPVKRIARPVVAASIRRPGVAGGLAVIALLILASPILGLSTGFNGARGLNDDVEAKAAFVALEENFTLGLAAPAQVVVDAGVNQNVFGSEIQRGVAALGDAVVAENARAAEENRHVPFGSGVETVINNAGDTEVVSIPINADTGEQKAFDAVALLREELIPEAFGDAPAEVLVTGQSAGQSDFTDNINARTPLVYGFVLITAFLLLLVMYRSPLIAVITVALNLLAVAAAYGALILVFQEGYAFEGLFGFEATGIIESWLPLFVFTIMFGISMDYLTFAIGRVKELHDEGLETESAIRQAVTDGFGVIFSAAAVMAAVAMVFAFTRDIGLQQFGFTLAVAVLLDATIILAVLLPAALRLAGDRLWYLPSWLDWLPGGRSAVVDPRVESDAGVPSAARR